MKQIKTLLVLLLACSVVLVSFPQIEIVKAKKLLNLTITPDGSIEPSTDLLERNGTTYTFKGDIFGTIMVQKDGITIDGIGYSIQGRKVVDERGIYLVGPDRSRPSCKHVVVKNLKILNFYEGIFVVGGSNNTIVGNYLEDAGIHLIGNVNITGDLIKHNTFKDCGIFVDYNPYGIDVITENDFFNGWIGVGLSDVPIVERNYWSDYNGTDTDGDGIGDTPHISKYKLNEDVLDNSPLMAPLDRAIPEFPLWLIMPLFLIVAVVAVIFKKRLTQNVTRCKVNRKSRT
jgi:hypothetical protein